MCNIWLKSAKDVDFIINMFMGFGGEIYTIIFLRLIIIFVLSMKASEFYYFIIYKRGFKGAVFMGKTYTVALLRLL